MSVKPRFNYLHVRLTPQERGIYSSLLSTADPEDTGKIGGADAVAFFRKFGVDNDLLKYIWEIAHQTQEPFLNKEEFYVALRLIAYAQNNQDISSQAIEMNIPAQSMPKINSIEETSVDHSSTTTTDQLQTPQKDSQAKTKASPLSLEQALDNIETYAPLEVPKTEEKKSVEGERVDVWAITAEENVKYMKVWNYHTKNTPGVITREGMQKLLEKSKLDRDQLMKVWDWSSQVSKNSDGFDEAALAVAMHALTRIKVKQQLPDHFPPSLLNSACRLNRVNFVEPQKEESKLPHNDSNDAVLQASFGNPQSNVVDSTPQFTNFDVQSEARVVESTQTKQTQGNVGVATFADVHSLNDQREANSNKMQSIRKNQSTKKQFKRSNTIRNLGPFVSEACGEWESILIRNEVILTQANANYQTLSAIFNEDGALLSDLRQRKHKKEATLDNLQVRIRELKAKISAERDLLDQDKSRAKKLETDFNSRLKELNSESGTNYNEAYFASRDSTPLMSGSKGQDQGYQMTTLHLDGQQGAGGNPFSFT